MDQHAEILEAIRNANETNRDAVELWRQDAAFVAGDQWDPAVRARRERKKRLCTTYNRTRPFVRHVVNTAMQEDITARVFPAGAGASTETAEIFDGIIRRITQDSNAQAARLTGLRHAVIGGFGFYRVDIEADVRGVPGIAVNPIMDPTSVVWDPAALEPDMSDAQFFALLTEVDEKAARAQFGEGVNLVPLDVDKPGGFRAPAASSKDSRVLLAEVWARVEGEDGPRVARMVIDGAQILAVDESYPGRYLPIVPVLGEVDVLDGKTQYTGLIRDAKEPARFFNYWRSEQAEFVSSRRSAPWILTPAHVAGNEHTWGDENAAFKLVNPDPQFTPQKDDGPPFPAAASALAAEAIDDLKASMGIYDASLGARSNEQSGRAIAARTAQGDLATYHFREALRRAVTAEARIMVDLIPHVYGAAEMLLVAGEDGTVTQADRAAVQALQARGPDGAFPVYGVRATSGPSYTTRNQEAAAILAEAARSFPLLGQVGADAFIRAVGMPGHETVAKRLRHVLRAQGMMPPDEVEAEDQKGQSDPEAMAARLRSAEEMVDKMTAELKQSTQTIQQIQQAAERAVKESQEAAQAAIQKAMIDARTKIEVARIQAEADAEVARIREAGSMNRSLLEAATAPAEPEPMMGGDSPGSPIIAISPGASSDWRA